MRNKIYIKKFTAGLVTVALMLVSHVMCFAEKNIEISAGNQQGSVGDTVGIPIKIENNTGFADLEIEIKYDSSALELTGVSNNLKGCQFTPAQNYTTVPYNMIWISEKENIHSNGVLARLEFKIKTDQPGLYPIYVSYYKGRDGKNEVGKDNNYAYADNKGAQENIPLNIKYQNGYVQVGKMVSDSVSVNVSVNGKSYSNQLESEYKATGIITAALFDKNNCLIAYKMCGSDANVNIDFGSEPNASYFKLMFWENTLNMKPLCKFPELVQCNGK